MTVDEALELFLEEQQGRLAPRTYRNYEDVIVLLRHCMSGYGPNILSQAEHRRWERAYHDGDEDAFCTLMPAGYIANMLDEFLGYFMIHKVMASQELLRASGTVTKKLVRWLQQQGLVDAEVAEAEQERAADAGRDLPRAERLANALYRLGVDAPVSGPADAERWIEPDLPLAITKVAAGELWFERGIGPLPVPKKISQLAKEGWHVTASFAYARGRWWVVEVGNVYP